jgi:hypothetical protein
LSRKPFAPVGLLDVYVDVGQPSGAGRTQLNISPGVNDLMLKVACKLGELIHMVFFAFYVHVSKKNIATDFFLTGGKQKLIHKWAKAHP